MLPRRPQDVPRCSQDASKSPQDASKKPQDVPRCLPDAPRCPKIPQDASQMPTRCPQDALRCSKMPPRCPKMPQHASQMLQDSLTAPRCRARWAVWPQALRSAAPCLQQGCRGVLDCITDTITDTEGFPHTPHCPPPHRVQPPMFKVCFFILRSSCPKYFLRCFKMPPRCLHFSFKNLITFPYRFFINF